MSPATVSVVIPCRDQRSDVLEALESVFAQTVPALEVIVIDDGSSDGSGDAVRERFGSRVRVLRAECGCASGARNVGWRAASGT